MQRLDKADPKKCKKKNAEKNAKKKKPKWADINESEWMNGGGKRHKNLNWLPRRVSVWECPPPSLPPFASRSLFPTLAEVLRPTSMRGVPVLVALFPSLLSSATPPSAVTLSLLDSFRSRCRRWRCRWRRRSRISVFAFHFALYFSFFIAIFVVFSASALLALTLTLLFLLLALSFSPSSSCDFA